MHCTRSATRFSLWLAYACAAAGLGASHLSQAEVTLDTLTVIGDDASNGPADLHDGQVEQLGGTGEVIPEEFAGSHRRIAGEALARRDVTLADLIAFEPGVQRRQVGGLGTFSSLTMRAATAAQTGVYLDGIRLNSAGNAVVDLSTLELLNLSAVDLYRGATPLQLGIGAIGGAVNLNSRRRSNDDDSTRVLLGGGSFGSYRSQLAHQSRHGRIDVLGTVSHQRSENDFPFLDDNGTALNPDDDRQLRRHNAQALQTTLMSRVSFLQDEQRRSDVLLQLMRRELGVPHYRNLDDNVASYGDTALQLQLGQTLDNVGRWNSRHTVFASLQDDYLDDRQGQVALGAKDITTDGGSLGAKTYWERFTSKGSVALTGEWRLEDYTRIDTLDDSAYRNAERREFSTLLQYTHFWLNDSIAVSPALGWRWTRDQRHLQNGEPEAALDDAVWSPRLGAQWQRGNTTWSFTVGHYHRQPTFGELYGNQGLVQGNSALDAERGTNADITLHWQASPDWRIEGSLFTGWRSELISTVYDSQGTGRAVNTGEARIVGLELANDIALSPAWQVRANLTVQDAISTNGHRVFDGKQLPGEARVAGYARLQYRALPWRAWFESSVSRDRYYDQANVLPAADYWLHSIGLDWKARRWRADIALNNITDRQVEDFNGFPRPGRQLSATVSFQLR